MSIAQRLKNFYFGHQIYSSLRQATGALMPALVIGGLFHQFAIGVPMTVGAFALAMLDQYGGQKKDRLKEFISACFLSALVALIAGFSSGYMVTLFIGVALICFCCAMLNVFGPRWGLIALTGLFVMILNVRTPTHGSIILFNALYTFSGAVFYLLYTLTVRRFVYLNEERRAIYVLLQNTAQYVRDRAALYDPEVDLDQAYRRIFATRSNLTAQFQTASDVLLSDFAKRRHHDQAEHHRLHYILVQAMGITDTLIATQVNYSSLRKHLSQSRFIQLCKQALDNAADDLLILTDRAIHGNKPLTLSDSTEVLHAISAEIHHYKTQGLFESTPVLRALMLQIVRRIRNVHFLLRRIDQSSMCAAQAEKQSEQIKNALNMNISPQQPFQWQLLRSNLNFNSPTFRYALRLTVAGLAGLLVPLALAHVFTDKLLFTAFTSRSYWVLLTLVLIIKPGFALTKQRNKRRLLGTLLGCVISFLLFQLHPSSAVLFILMWLLYVLALCYLPLNYFYGATFVTVFIMIAFYFLHESGTFVIAERIIDTSVGCALALVLSYLFPSWESASLKGLAQTSVTSCARMLQLTQETLNTKTQTTDIITSSEKWRQAKTTAQNALSNFNTAFLRMLDEPQSHRHHVPTYNQLMVQLFILKAQITALNYQLAQKHHTPPVVQLYLQVALDRLQGVADSSPLPTLPTAGLSVALIPPLQQIIATAATIRDCLHDID